ncbi:MAG TPA: peroxidase family protein [Candidatus Limnocylindrales bacterium]|nr:peroxidase family protein [Candidatus Limnocylindrales bacterium]
MRVNTRLGRRRTPLLASLAVLAVVGALGFSGTAVADDGGVSDAPILGIWEVQSLNGINNNPFSPRAASAGTNYLRLGPTRYADGRSAQVSGPNARNVSNRVFNDDNVNVFSERDVTQWGFVWGQFVDHTFGLRQENGTTANIPFSATDPLEDFRNDLGVIPFVRSAAAPGTGVSNARQHVNTLNSFIDAEVVYGNTDARLDWLREGFQDGNPDNNGSRLLMPSNYLPRRDSRGNPAAAPTMAVDGRLLSNPNRAAVAGDVRANENISLTATQTLFAREHNRIASLLPSSLSSQDRFQLARAVVIAEQQFITYNEFLPALGVTLPAYQGYDASFNPALSQEFAAVAYRAHSMIHGEVEIETNVSRYSSTTLNALRAQGVEVEVNGADVAIAVPLGVGFFNPDLVQQIQLGPLLQGIGLEPEYKNEELIDNQLRSVLFKVPVSSNPECLDGPTLPECFNGVVDLGAIDIQRGRDHGVGTYNQVRNAFGLPSKTTFTSITGESTESFPAGLGINSPECLDIVALFDINGNPTTVENDNAVRMVRRCSTAAKLKAIYGSVSNVDAFTGIVAEAHLSGVEMGETQRAIFREQFQALRDGDRFFYLNDPLQPFIRNNFGIDYRKTLAQIIALNTDIPLGDLAANVFKVAPGAAAATASASTAAADPVPSDMTRHNSSVASNANVNKAVVPSQTGPRSLGRRRRYDDPSSD